MSKKNYTKYSENTNNENVTIEEVNETIKNNEEVNETIENNKENLNTPIEENVKPEENIELEENQNKNNDEKNTGAVVPGVVSKCIRLNVRSEATKDSDVLCVIDKGTKLTVDMEESTDDFYKVYFEYEGIIVEGYCLKDFIELK